MNGIKPLPYKLARGPHERRLPNRRRLIFTAIRGTLSMQTRLSARLFYRGRTGWRRDEWADSPLFICGKIWPDWTDLKGLGRVGAAVSLRNRILTANRAGRRQI